MKISIWNVISYDQHHGFTTQTFTKKSEAEAEYHNRIENDWNTYQDQLMTAADSEAPLPFPDTVDDAYRMLLDLDDYKDQHLFEDVELDFTNGKFSRREFFTALEMEAALCAWEWMLENVKHQVFHGIWEGLGYAAMRHCSYQGGAIALQVYDHMTALNYEFVSAYDWEFVPGVLRRLDWRKLAEDNQYSGEPYKPDVAAIFDDMLTEFPEELQHTDPRTTWLNRARAAAKRLWGYPELLTDHPELFDQAFEEGQKPDLFVEELGKDLDLTPANRIR